MSETPTLPSRILVALIQSKSRLVLNKGSEDGITYGQRFLIYSLGAEIFDPETQHSLGKLEIVKGTGRVAHLQEKMSIIQSDMKSDPLKTIRKSASSRTLAAVLGGLDIVEEQLPPQEVPFSDPQVGDIARPI